MKRLVVVGILVVMVVQGNLRAESMDEMWGQQLMNRRMENSPVDEYQALAQDFNPVNEADHNLFGLNEKTTRLPVTNITIRNRK